VNSVPDFVTPEHAKFSFGASADFDAMRAAFAEVGNHIDGLNVFLAGLGVAGTLDLEGMLAPVVDASNAIHELAGGDLSEFLSATIEQPLMETELGPLVQDVADTLTEGHQMLFQLEGAIKAPLLALQDSLEEILIQNFSDENWIDQYAAVALYGPDSLAGISGMPAGFDMAAAETRVQQFRAGLDETLRMTDSMLTTITGSLTTLCADDICQQGKLAFVKQKLQDADNAVNTLAEALTGNGAYTPYLSNNAANPIIMKLHQAKGTFDQASSTLKNFNVASVIKAMQAAANLAGAELSSSQLAGTEEQLTHIKQWLIETLDHDRQLCVEAEQSLNTIYASQPFTLMAQLTNMQHNGLLDQNGPIRSKLTNAITAVTELQDRILYLTVKAPARIEQIRPVLAMLRDVVDEDESLPTGSDWSQCMAESKKQFDGAARELNATFRKSNPEACITGADAGACFKVVFGPNVVDLATWITEPLLADVSDDINNPGLEKLFADIERSVTGALPMPTPDDIRKMVVSTILNNDTVQQINGAFYTLFSPIKDQLDDVASHVTMIVNEAITDLTTAVNQALGEKLAQVTSMGPNDAENPLAKLAAAKVNGYAISGQDELERLHLDFEFKLKPDPKKAINFFVGFDVSAWGAENGKGGCTEGVAGDYYDVKISTKDVSAAMLGSDVGIKQAMFGMTIAGTPPPDFPLQISPCPVGIFGGLYTLGGFDLDAMTLLDLGLECGFGTSEAYLGATGRGSFDSFSVSMAAFYVGRSCDAGVIKRLDSEVGNFIQLEDGQPLTGAYVRGGVEIPLYTYGCPCEIGAGIDVGGWYFTEPKTTFGGLLGGSLFGRLGCVGYLKGKILCMLEPAGDKVKYSGTAWAAAGAGLCTTSKWRTVDDVRADGPLCFTADTTFGVTYIDEFELEEPAVNCCN